MNAIIKTQEELNDEWNFRRDLEDVGDLRNRDEAKLILYYRDLVSGKIPLWSFLLLTGLNGSAEVTNVLDVIEANNHFQNLAYLKRMKSKLFSKL
jgi:hypothetical protein